MVGYAAGHGLNVVLSVNAPELSAGMAERLLMARPSKIIVSLDGTDQETYARLRGPRAKFSTAVDNTRAAARLKLRLGSDVRITVRMIRLYANSHQAEAFRTFWEGEGLDVEIRGFFPWGEKDLAGLGAYATYPDNMPCPFPWQHLVVQWNGDVVPCCRDFNGSIVLGNVGNRTLKAIWNAESYRLFRLQHRRGDFDRNRTCRECTELYCATVPSSEVLLPLPAREILYWTAHLGTAEAAADHIGLPRGSRRRLFDDLANRGHLARTPGGPLSAPVTTHPGRPPMAEDDLTTLWQRAVDANREGIFLVDSSEGSRFTYGDAGSIVDAMTRRMRAAGLSQGDCIVIWAPLHVEAILLFWAAAALGVLVAPLDPRLSAGQARQAVSQLFPRLVFADPTLCGTLNGPWRTIALDTPQPPPEGVPAVSSWIRPEDREATPSPARVTGLAPRPAAVLFTSGSLGRPKGVVLAQSAIAHSGRLMARVFGWGPGDVLLSTGQFHTMSGLRNPTAAAAIAGARVIVAPGDLWRHPSTLIECVQKSGVTILTSVPAILRQIVAVSGQHDRQALSSLRMVLVTGSRLPRHVREVFQDRIGVPVYNYYGLTETAGFCAGERPGECPGGEDSIGREVDALFRVVDDEETEVQPGKVGELWIQSANLMLGYLGDEASSRSASAGRWFRTGDLVRRAPDGAIELKGRKGDCIKTAQGEIVFAAEVEVALMAGGDVSEAFVRPARTSIGEEALEAFVVPASPVPSGRADAWLYQLQKGTAAHIAPRRVSIQIFLRECLHRGAAGKVIVEGPRE